MRKLMDDCVFCKIVKGKIPAKVERETSNLLVFEDLNPKAPIHLLIIPKKHVENIREDSGVIWGAIGKLAVKIANDKKVAGFRLVHNAGDAAAVAHMHVHFLGKVALDREV